MAKLQANQKNYKTAFTKHIHTYLNTEGSNVSRRLLLCYCVECGLKCLIMKNNNIYRISQASEEVAEVLGSHDFRRLLKEVNQAGNYKFKNFKTEYNEDVTPGNFHQICRYCINPKKGKSEHIKKYEGTLEEITEWLKEVI